MGALMGAESITSFIMNWLQLIVIAAGGFVFQWMRGEIRGLKERVENVDDQVIELKIQYGHLDAKFGAINEKLNDIKNETRDTKNALLRLLSDKNGSIIPVP